MLFKKSKTKKDNLPKKQKGETTPNPQENWEIKFLLGKLENTTSTNNETNNSCTCALSNQLDANNASVFKNNNGDVPDRVKLRGVY